MNDELMREALGCWGGLHQRLKAVEELTELARAVLLENRASVVEEMADAEIMMRQMTLLYGVDSFRAGLRVKEKNIAPVLMRAAAFFLENPADDDSRTVWGLMYAAAVTIKEHFGVDDDETAEVVALKCDLLRRRMEARRVEVYENLKKR